MQTVDPDQTPISAASDLGLHCLPMSLWDARHINGLMNSFETGLSVILTQC